MWIVNHSLKHSGLSLKKFFLGLLLFLLLPLGLGHAMTQDDILNNLTVSSQLLTTLNNQLAILEQDLTNKNQSLQNLATANQDLNLQLTTLTQQFNQQTTTLTNLSETNNKLMDLWAQSEEQSDNLSQQLTSLSEELRKQESNKIWGITLGIIGGIAAGLVVGWAITTYM